MTERFTMSDDGGVGLWTIYDNGKWLSVRDIVERLNTFHEENTALKRKIDIKNRCCANSHNAHQFLRCYEKATNDLEEEYKDNPVAMEVLDKLDEYYTKYEREVDLE